MFQGVEDDINVNLSDYDEDLKQVPLILRFIGLASLDGIAGCVMYLMVSLTCFQMGNLTKEEFVHILRR